MRVVSSYQWSVARKTRTKRMSQKIPIWLLATVLLLTNSLAQAQQPTKLPRVGYLSVSSLPAMVLRTDAFRQGLRELGYVEGKNIVIEWRYGDGKPGRVGELTAELVRLKVDVIVTGG
jgi:putative ABC transport system substrate-binding protein